MQLHLFRRTVVSIQAFDAQGREIDYAMSDGDYTIWTVRRQDGAVVRTRHN